MINDYIGIPYQPNGRTRSGADCWGLVVMVLREEYGVHVPALTGEYSHADKGELERFIDEAKATVRAVPVDAPDPGDLAVLRYRGKATHVGVYVGEGLLLHNVGGDYTSRVERIDGAGIARRIEGWYRVR
jgi:cell wall-associated NlpC family hydrolase